MKFRIKHVTINSEKSGEVEYDMDRPDWEFNTMMHEISQHYPTITSLVVVLVRRDEDGRA